MTLLVTLEMLLELLRSLEKLFATFVSAAELSLTVGVLYVSPQV